MRTFSHTITDPLGIHARPAGMLAKEARKYASVCTLTRGDESVRLTQLMALMALTVRSGDVVRITVEGADEDAAAEGLHAFFKEHL